MIDHIISFSIRNKLIIGLLMVGIIGWGAYSFKQIPMDAVPDITNNQVQVITQAPTLAAQEVEQFITFPIEVSMANLPDVVEIRSISRFGISVVTVVFEEGTDIFLARQLITEQLKIAEGEIPDGFGEPELGPITTGLGEVYQYILHTAPGYDTVYSAMDLRTINDWIVKRQLAGTPGVIEISGWGGFLKQYEVAVHPDKLKAQHVTMAEVFEAIEKNNENTGGSYIEKRFNTYFIRGEGMVNSLDDIRMIVVKTIDGIPILVRDVAEVRFGSAPRYGAVTWNGKGEVVGGQALMLKGENSLEVVSAVKERIETIRKSLPEGVELRAFIDRSELIDRAIHTVSENLILGGLIVIFILVFLLGNLRGGLIVASTIPLSMLFALGMMNTFGVSANLMSLGALDFGIIVDGAVIIVESVVFYWARHLAERSSLTQAKMDEVAQKSSSKMMNSAFFGQLIILIVFLPILTLEGIEGKMFGPMALTVTFAMIGAIILSLTYIPMMSALLLKPGRKDKKSFAERITEKLQNAFEPVLRLALRLRFIILGAGAIVLIGTYLIFSRLGGEFIPTLEEGDFAIHQILPPGSSLRQSVEVSEKVQTILLENFPEVEDVVVKIGTAEIPTDPMPIEVGDIMVKMKPKSEWTTAKSKEEMFEIMEEKLSVVPGLSFEFTQPIQMRFNELMTGVRQDIAVKIYGEDLDILYQRAKEAEKLIKAIDGVGDLRVEQVTGLPQMVVRYNRERVAQYGLNIHDLNQTLKTGFAGEKAGVVFENERRFDMVVRLEEGQRQDIENIRNLYVTLPNGNQIPLKEVASIEVERGPMQISRENTRRRITIGINARGRDVESLTKEIDTKLASGLELPPGYSIEYGGAFENLKSAKERLSIVVPLALALIFLLVFFALRSLKYSLIIFMAIPFAAIGGVWALWIRDMPFSISAGVGFIVLSGVAVLNGLVLIHSMTELKEEGVEDLTSRIIQGTRSRLRPILLTASTDILGFLPMALSTSGGAEVQRPLATVVIGGLLSATVLTLLVIPVLYSLAERGKLKLGKKAGVVAGMVLATILFLPASGSAQSADTLTADKAVEIVLANHPAMQGSRYRVEQQEVLRKSAVDIPRTSLQYTRGQINSAFVDYSFEVTQNIDFPTLYSARGKLQDERIELSRISTDVTALELEGQVRSLYANLSYQNQRVDVYRSWEKQYERFAQVASKRYEAGETNLLEKTAAVTRFQEIGLLVRQAEAEQQAAARQFGLLIGVEAPVVISAVSGNGNTVLADTALSADLPYLRFYEQQIKVNERSVSLAKQSFLPGFSAGYFNQQIDGTGGLYGFQVGVDFRLFFGAEKSRLESTRLGTEVARTEYAEQQLKFQMEIEAAQLRYRSSLVALDFFRNSALPNADQLSSTAKKSYEAGEIGYVEFIENMDKAFEIRLNFHDALDLAQQNLIKLNLLTGKF